MQFESNIYSEAWRVLRLCPAYVALAVFGEFTIAILKETTSFGNGTTVASALVWSFLAFAAHAEVLLGSDRDKTREDKRMFGFALRTFGLVLVAALPILVLAFSAAARLRNAGDPDAAEVGLILVLLPVFGASSLLVFSMAGTLLPAFVADRGRGLRAAFARGWRQFFWVAGRLLIGPGPVFVLAFSTLFIPVLLVAAEDATILSASYVPNPIATVSMLVGFAIQSYATVMVAVVLSRAFLRDRGERGEQSAEVA